MNSFTKIEDRLYLGGFLPMMSRDFLKKYNIKTIISLNGMETPHKNLVNNIIYNAKDNSNEQLDHLFNDVYREILRGKEKGGVYVHCTVGISRSATVVIYYIMKSRNWPLSKAYKYVKVRRRNVNPNSHFMFLLMKNDIFGRER